MWNKIKKIGRFLKRLTLVAVVISGLVLAQMTVIYVSYTEGQMDACNAMLRNDPNTRLYGLYCEQMAKGVMVRSSVLKKSLFNITLDETHFIIED